MELESRKGAAGDAGFAGVNERIAPDKLPQGTLAGARNIRLRHGEAQTRGGITIRPVGAGADGLTPFAAPQAATVYRTPDNQEWMVFCAGGATYRCQPNLSATVIPQPDGLQFPGPRAVVVTGFGLGNANTTYYPAGTSNGRVYYTGVDMVWPGFNNTLEWVPADGSLPARWRIVMGASVTQCYWESTAMTPEGVNEWYQEFGGGYFTITAEATGTVPERVRFVQAGDSLYAFRGENFSTLELPLGDFAAGWREVTQENSASGNGTGTLTIPNGSRGMYFQERLWIVTRAGLYVSDVRNFTRYSLLNVFRIESGALDELLNVTPFGANSFVAFKSRSVHGRYNLIPDSNGDLTPAYGDVLSSAHGMAAADCMVQAGADVFFFGENGLTSIRLTEENRLQSVATPLSEPMRVLWRRINWSALHTARLAYWDSKLYWAVPVDGSRVANCVAVYDLQTQSWNGTDEGAVLAFGIVDWMVVRYAGEPRLFALDGRGHVRLYEEPQALDHLYGVLLSEVDRTPLLAEGTREPLLAEVPELLLEPARAEIVTRGYGLGTAWSRIAEVATALETLDARVQWTAQLDGTDEAHTLLPDLVPDRTRSTRWNGPVYDTANPLANHGERHREDYSVVLPEGGMFLGTGIQLGRHQDWTVNRRLGERCRFVQVRVRNTRGFVQIKAIEVRGAVTGSGRVQRT